MDPLSITASVIAVATAALQSASALCSIIDGVSDAPRSIAHSRTLLSQTQTALGALTHTFKENSAPEAINSILKSIELSKALESTDNFFQEFATALKKYTSRSTDSHFSKRDRLLVQFNETKINKLNMDLAACQRTITMVLSSITLIVSSRTSGDIDRLQTQFGTQEQALADLGAQLSKREPELPADDCSTADDRDLGVLLTASLLEICQKTLLATRTQRTEQKFGDMNTDNQSIAMQGIVGDAQPGVNQSFGRLTTTASSRAFQGQMDSASFGNLFGK